MGDVVQFGPREDNRTVDEVLAQIAYDVEFRIAENAAALTEKKALLALFFGTEEEYKRLVREVKANNFRGALKIVK